MNRKQLIVLLAMGSMLLSGCVIFEFPSFLMEQKPNSVNYAHKNDDSSQPKIETGMSRLEALSKWGKPEMIVRGLKADIEEMWFYRDILSVQGGFYGQGRHIIWELYFKNDMLMRITKMLRHTEFRPSQETLKYYKDLVDVRLEEDGLRINAAEVVK